MSNTKSPRIEIIDALRGFALAEILICKMAKQYLWIEEKKAYALSFISKMDPFEKF